jgi:signal peptidase I
MKRALLTLLLLVAVGATVAKLFLFEIPVVTGNDMAPTLQAGDRLLAYRLDTTPARGDLVLLEQPGDGGLLIRRVLGGPGDRVAVRDETPVVNGRPATRAPLREVTLSDLLDGQRKEIPMRLVEETLGDRGYLVLKDPRRHSKDYAERELSGAYFVLADNRNHGRDSRNFGPVPATKIRAVISRRLSAGPGSLLGEGPRKGWTPLR